MASACWERWSAAAGAVAAPLWGAAADHFRSPRAVMPLAAAGAAVSAALLSVVTPVLPLVVTAAALAGFMAGVAPILDARALEVAGGDRNRYSLLRVWGSGSFIVSVLLVGWLIDQTQITAMFAVLAGALFVTGLIGLAFRGQAGVAAAAPHLAGIGAVLRSPVIGPFLLAILLVWSSNMAINAFFSIHLVDIGAESALVGASWAIGALVEIPVMLGYPWLGGRFGVERLLLVGASAFLVRAIAVLVLHDPVFATATMAVHGIGFALVLVGGVVYVSRHAPPGHGCHRPGRAGRHGVRRGRHPRPGRGRSAGRLAGTGGHVHGGHHRLWAGGAGAGLGAAAAGPGAARRASGPDPRALRVVERLGRDLRADPLAEDLHLATLADLRAAGGQVAVGDAPRHRVPVAAGGDATDHLAVDPDRLIAQRHRLRVIQHQAAQPPVHRRRRLPPVPPGR